MLLLVFVNIIFHYAYYFLFYKGLIDYSTNLAFLIVPFSSIAPLIVYYYCMSVLYGKLRYTRVSILHYVPIVIIGAISLFSISMDENSLYGLLVAKILSVSLYVVYPFLIVKMIANFYGLKRINLDLFKYNKKKTYLIRVLCAMMLVHFFILVVKIYSHFYGGQMESVMDVINICYLMFLGYALSYVIISEPKSIHYTDEKVGLAAFKKYEKSGLSRMQAEKNAVVLNYIMDEKKPYLDCEFNLSTFSKLSNIPSYEISETLNGLMSQNFNDYVNNYRVEEFKKYLLLNEYKNFTFLALAFEAGFKSKATFNSSFKKITGMTPSEYKKSL